MRSIFIDFDNHIIGRPHLSTSLMDLEILIREKWKGDVICFLEYFYFIRRIPCADAN
jgi:hypothetical protein